MSVSPAEVEKFRKAENRFENLTASPLGSSHQKKSLRAVWVEYNKLVFTILRWVINATRSDT
jgi:hypothetical protein